MWALLLGRLTREEEVVVGTPVAGRPHRDLEGVVGPLLNMVALRVRVSGERRFEQLLGEVKASVVDALEHQELPFEKLVEATTVDRAMNRAI